VLNRSARPSPSTSTLTEVRSVAPAGSGGAVGQAGSIVVVEAFVAGGGAVTAGGVVEGTVAGTSVVVVDDEVVVDATAVAEGEVVVTPVSADSESVLALHPAAISTTPSATTRRRAVRRRFSFVTMVHLAPPASMLGSRVCPFAGDVAGRRSRTPTRPRSGSISR
jgi:hypothetical protein